MKIKFNRFERVAGIFVLVAIGGTIVAMVAAGIKRGWFEARTELVTVFDHAEGLYPGTVVQMAGLRAGAVDEVELTPDNHVRVRFSIKNQFFARAKEDSRVQIIRPFIIGEKALDLSVGAISAKPLVAGATVGSVDSMDLLDLVSGKALGSQLATMARSMESMRVVLEAITDPKRVEAFVETLDSIHPLLINLGVLSKEGIQLARKVNRSDDLEQVIHNAALLTTEVNKILPELNQSAPHFGRDLGQMSQEIAGLTQQLSKLTPIFEQMAPEMPHASRRVLEALDETVVTLKALQKSFLLRGAAKDVRAEEKVRDEKQRKPASDQEAN